MSHSFERAPTFGRASEAAASKPAAERAALTVGPVAALLTGACCVAPLVLVTVGLGGAWLSILPLFEPYQPIFIGVALAALAFAGWRIYRPVAQCSPGDACAMPHVRRRYRLGFWIVATLLLGMIGFPYLAPLLY